MAAPRITLREVKRKDSQHEPTTQIHASNLLRAIGESRGDRDCRRKKSGGESDEGTTEQHWAGGEGKGWG